MNDLNAIEPPAARASGSPATAALDLICYSHLRWDFVYQRPQHLLSRCARDRRVFFFEEPKPSEGAARLDVERRDCGVHVATPRLPPELAGEQLDRALRALLDQLLRRHGIGPHIAWYYTPMALGFSGHLAPVATVYDCMDELSSFAFAPASLRAREAELFARASVVFTGGHSLYQAKRDRHPAVHPFPSSIDAAHFRRARRAQPEPADQARIKRPRIGYFGVIDERIDLALIAGIAERQPDWQIVMVGPVAKISPDSLPRRPNIHYLGAKPYAELPAYIAGWDVAFMPFARNSATRYISPTKTPEYLAAGRPVVSTSIRDVVHPYATRGLVEIADAPAPFVAAIAAALAETDRCGWLAQVDEFLAGNSWDATWARMRALIGQACRAKDSRCSTI